VPPAYLLGGVAGCEVQVAWTLSSVVGARRGIGGRPFNSTRSVSMVTPRPSFASRWVASPISPSVHFPAWMALRMMALTAGHLHMGSMAAYASVMALERWVGVGARAVSA
jgi:hypothetical protein